MAKPVGESRLPIRLTLGQVQPATPAEVNDAGYRFDCKYHNTGWWAGATELIDLSPLESVFDHVLSPDRVRVYKPDPHAHQWASMLLV